jgi:hypothetical protein
MTAKVEPYVPASIGELLDYLSFMMLRAPTFEDKTGYLPGRNVETVFFGLNEGIKSLHNKLGTDRCRALLDISNQMRAYFEADPEKKSGGTLKGRELILEMEDLIKARGRSPSREPPGR